MALGACEMTRLVLAPCKVSSRLAVVRSEARVLANVPPWGRSPPLCPPPPPLGLMGSHRALPANDPLTLRL
eukprot:1772568-Pyramimonas_sp.AAC.1